MKVSVVGMLLLVSLCLKSGLVSSSEFRVAVSEHASDIIRVEDGRLAGLAAPLYECVFEHAGLDFTFVELPLARVLFHLENGEVAAAIPLARSPERDRYGVFPGTLVDVRYLFLSFHELPPLDTATDLRYVLPRGHLGKQFLNNLALVGIEVNTWQQVFTMLRLGRADFTIVPQSILGQLRKEIDSPLFTQVAGFIPASLYVSRAFLDTRLDQRVTEGIDVCYPRFSEQIQQETRPGPSEGEQ